MLKNIRAKSILKKFGVDSLINKDLKVLEGIRGLGKKGALELYHYLQMEKKARFILNLPECYR